MNTADRLQNPLCEPYCVICFGPFTEEPWNEGMCYSCQALMQLPDDQLDQLIADAEARQNAATDRAERLPDA